MAARVITDMFFGFGDYYFGGQGVITKKRWLKKQRSGACGISPDLPPEGPFTEPDLEK